MKTTNIYGSQKPPQIS